MCENENIFMCKENVCVRESENANGTKPFESFIDKVNSTCFSPRFCGTGLDQDKATKEI